MSRFMSELSMRLSVAFDQQWDDTTNLKDAFMLSGYLKMFTPLAMRWFRARTWAVSISIPFKNDDTGDNDNCFWKTERLQKTLTRAVFLI